MKTHSQLYDFLNSYNIGVISTVNQDGLPQGAIISFGQTKDLEIVFGTNNTTRKYQNLAGDPHIAFTIGGATLETIQYEGIVRELDKSELDIVRETHWKKNPHLEKLSQIPEHRYFIASPSWIRYTNISAHPWDITELTF